MATILIVDDARSTLRALDAMLKREGYNVGYSDAMTIASNTRWMSCCAT